MTLELDFSKCKNKEDVEKVFSKKKKEIETINQAKRKI